MYEVQINWYKLICDTHNLDSRKIVTDYNLINIHTSSLDSWNIVTDYNLINIYHGNKCYTLCRKT